MAKRKRDTTPGYGRLLDAWTPPAKVGDPVGCIASSFTFDPALFEEECLARFLRLDSDPTTDGRVHLIEREEKMSQLTCAAAIVDQHHCKGFRSLRWDLLPARPASGILHAKVALLHWTNCTRLIVGSANLTEDGYRRNREVYGVLDYRADSEAPRTCLEQTLTFLNELLGYTAHAPETNPSTLRCRELLDQVRQASAEWGQPEPSSPRSTVTPVFTGGARPSAIDTIRDLWPVKRRPHLAAVASPFFDPPTDGANRPAASLWSHLRVRGAAKVQYHVTAEQIPGESATLVHAPYSLVRAQPAHRKQVTPDVCRIPDEPSRPFHAKALWLEGGNWVGYMIGSSNFTTPGMGLGQSPNLEANLLYLAGPNDEEAEQALGQAFPKGELLDSDQELRWHPVPNEDDAEAEPALLPAAFDTAYFCRDENGEPFIRLHFTAQPPADWGLWVEQSNECFYEESAWREAGQPMEVNLPWPSQTKPPQGFTVYWHDHDAGAWWPVNVENNYALPPPEELRDLPLEMLIEILTSARPLHEALRRWIKQCDNGHLDQLEKPAIDSHKRVDTSSFVLRRTRRVAWALRGLRQRLEQPAATRQSLHWRLYGPVGVEALANALSKGTSSDEERAFMLAELALEISRVRPGHHPGAVDRETVRAELARAVERVREHIPSTSVPAESNLRHYIDDAFKHVNV